MRPRSVTTARTRAPFVSSATTSTFFFFQAEDGIRDLTVTGVQTCALPISLPGRLSCHLHDRFGRPGGGDPWRARHDPVPGVLTGRARYAGQRARPEDHGAGERVELRDPRRSEPREEAVRRPARAQSAHAGPGSLSGLDGALEDRHRQGSRRRPGAGNEVRDAGCGSGETVGLRSRHQQGKGRGAPPPQGGRGPRRLLVRLQEPRHPHALRAAGGLAHRSVATDRPQCAAGSDRGGEVLLRAAGRELRGGRRLPDRKSTRLNSSHSQISYAVFCLKKKNRQHRFCGTASWAQWIVGIVNGDCGKANYDVFTRSRVFARAGVNVSDSASPVSSYNTTVQIHHLWRIRFPSDFIGDVPCSWRMNKCAQSSKVHFPARSRNREGCPGRLNRNTYDTRFSRATRNAEQNCGSKKA